MSFSPRFPSQRVIPHASKSLYSDAMPARQPLTCDPLPRLWLLSDRRNDAGLSEALRRLPPQSGFIFRHYHLPPAERRERFAELARIARGYGHLILLSDQPETARHWRADGIYGKAALSPAPGLLRFATAHDLAEIAAANRAATDALLLSPAFPTRSHPGASALGATRFRLLASRAAMPVIALGGMDADSAKRLAWPRWAAIDGLSHPELS